MLLEKCTEMRFNMPDNNGNRIMNIIFRISIIGVFYTGLKAIYNYYVLMQG